MGHKMKCANFNNTGRQSERDYAASQAVEYRKTGNVFEFGTYHGHTTACLAEVATHVYTLDLPEGHGEVEISPEKDLGQFYKFHGLTNITQFQEDSMTFDMSVVPECDLVVIDATHDYEHTLNDCTKGFSVLRKGGCLLVHDAHYADVKRCLDEHFKPYELIKGTRYAKLLHR